MIETVTSELQLLIHEGGWVLIALILLAAGIAWSLLRIWGALVAPRRFMKTQSENADFEELNQSLFDPLDRRIKFAFVLISAAPLLGLLGTVTGMLLTFSGLSRAAANAPVDVISRGVSEALITTQTGLIIGVPTFIVCTMLKNQFEQLRLEFEQLASAARQR